MAVDLRLHGTGNRIADALAEAASGQGLRRGLRHHALPVLTVFLP